MSDETRTRQNTAGDDLPHEGTGHDEGHGAEAVAETGGAVSGRSASLWSDALRELRTNPLFILSGISILVFAVAAIAPQLLGTGDPNSCSLSRSADRPDWPDHPFGFDLQGCDYYTLVVYGVRVSMLIGVGVVGGAIIIAVLLGSLTGYYGGVLDSVIARITDIWFAIPLTLAAIVMLNSVFTKRGLLQVSIVLIVFGWPTMMRLARSQVLSVREVDYVMAAKSLGASDFRIITKHILPNAMAPVIVYATIYVGIIISAEAALSFLGVGLQLPAISWGLMISVADSRIQQDPHLLFFPAVFLSIMVFSFILLGDALRDALDPKLR